MKMQIVTWGVAFLISALIGLVRAVAYKKTFSQKVVDIIISGILGTVAATAFQLQLELVSIKEIRNAIITPNPLKDVETKLEQSSPHTPMLNSMVMHKELLKDELKELLNGTIKLRDGVGVINEWERMFKESGTVIDATNYVSVDFWAKGSEFSAKQLLVQQEAIKRGVKIRRIFIYDGGPEEIEQTKKLSEEHHIIGIEVKFIQKSKLESIEGCSGYVSNLGGTVDFVIFDSDVVLLTYVNNTRNIRNGDLTKERKKVDCARNLFKILWSMSADKIY